MNWRSRRRDVVVGFAIKRFYEGEIIHVLRDVGIMLADPRSGLAVLLEGKRGLHERAGVAVEDIDFNALTVAFGQLGLGIEDVHGARCAFHEKPDDRLRLRRKMSDARRHRAERVGRGERVAFSEQIGQREHPESGSRLFQKIAPRGDGLEASAVLVDRVHASVDVDEFVQSEERLAEIHEREPLPFGGGLLRVALGASVDLCGDECAGVGELGGRGLAAEAE